MSKQRVLSLVALVFLIVVVGYGTDIEWDYLTQPADECIWLHRSYLDVFVVGEPRPDYECTITRWRQWHTQIAR